MPFCCYLVTIFLLYLSFPKVMQYWQKHEKFTRIVYGMLHLCYNLQYFWYLEMSETCGI